jgi:hypothetical protein
MDARILKDIIAVIKNEQQRRASLLTEKDPDAADAQWLFTDMPFVNDLYLMLLVTLRHQVERELVRLAARATEDGKEINGLQYRNKVRELRKQVRRQGWEETIEDRLKLKSCTEYASMEVLRHLSNSYKHNPFLEPDEKLLEALKLKTRDDYAPLPESPSLEERLAIFVGLGKDATYCDTTERFVDKASAFLADVQKRTNVSRVKRGPVSLVHSAH